MDRARSNPPNTASRLIAMAVSLVGDSRRVMEQMRCSEADFQLYCAGEREPGWSEYDRLIALIVDEQGIIIAKNRELLNKLRERRNS
jgi:hypothetical protein